MTMIDGQTGLLFRIFIGSHPLPLSLPDVSVRERKNARENSSIRQMLSGGYLPQTGDLMLGNG